MPYKKLNFPGPRPHFTKAMKAKIAFELVTGRLSKAAAARTYQVSPGTIHYWIRHFDKLGSLPNLGDMTDHPKKGDSMTQIKANTQIAKSNEQLKEALRLAQLKIIALETLIDTAESELLINIRKKSAAKQ